MQKEKSLRLSKTCNVFDPTPILRKKHKKTTSLKKKVIMGGDFLRRLRLRHLAYRDHIGPSTPWAHHVAAHSPSPAGKQALLNTDRHYLKLRRLIGKLLSVVFRVLLCHMNML